MENLRKLYILDSKPASPTPIVSSPAARRVIVLIACIALATLVDPAKLPLPASMRVEIGEYQKRFGDVHGRLADGLTSLKLTLQCAVSSVCRGREAEAPTLTETAGGMLIESSAAATTQLPPELATCTTRDRMRPVKDITAACDAFVASNKGTNRDRALALLHAGYAVQRDGRFDDAKKTWDRAISMDPEFAEPYVAQADWVILENDYLGAISFYETAVRIDPRNARAFTGIGRARTSLLDYDRSFEAFEKALAIDPGGAETNYYFGLVLEQAGNFESAADAYEKASVAYSSSIGASPIGLVGFEHPLGAAARAKYRAGNAEAAIVLISRMFEVSRPSPMDFATRATYYEATGRYAEAAEDIEKALPHTPEHMRVDLKARLAINLKNAGQADKAEARFSELLNSGGKRAVLRIQVFLKHHGYKSVPISGTNDSATQEALKDCLASTQCNAAVSKAI